MNMNLKDQSIPAHGGGWLNISASRQQEWAEAFPGVDVQQEIENARAWLTRNKSKRWKTLTGMERWLKNATGNRPQAVREHVSDPAKSRHPSVRYEHREYGASTPTPDHQRGAHLAYLNRVTKGRYGRQHPDLSEPELAAVAGAPMPADVPREIGEPVRAWQARMLKEHRRCWREFKKLLESRYAHRGRNA